MTECIQGIRVIKYFGWEKMIIKTMEKIRNLEILIFFKFILYAGYRDLITKMSPPIIYLLVFGVYIGQGYKIDSAQAFTIINIFTLLELPVRVIGFI